MAVKWEYLATNRYSQTSKSEFAKLFADNTQHDTNLADWQNIPSDEMLATILFNAAYGVVQRAKELRAAGGDIYTVLGLHPQRHTHDGGELKVEDKGGQGDCGLLSLNDVVVRGAADIQRRFANKGLSAHAGRCGGARCIIQEVARAVAATKSNDAASSIKHKAAAISLSGMGAEDITRREPGGEWPYLEADQLLALQFDGQPQIPLFPVVELGYLSPAVAGRTVLVVLVLLFLLRAPTRASLDMQLVRQVYTELRTRWESEGDDLGLLGCLDSEEVRGRRSLDGRIQETYDGMLADGGVRLLADVQALRHALLPLARHAQLQLLVLVLSGLDLRKQRPRLQPKKPRESDEAFRARTSLLEGHPVIHVFTPAAMLNNYAGPTPKDYAYLLARQTTAHFKAVHGGYGGTSRVALRDVPLLLPLFLATLWGPHLEIPRRGWGDFAEPEALAPSAWESVVHKCFPSTRAQPATAAAAAEDEEEEEEEEELEEKEVEEVEEEDGDEEEGDQHILSSWWYKGGWTLQKDKQLEQLFEDIRPDLQPKYKVIAHFFRPGKRREAVGATVAKIFAGVTAEAPDAIKALQRLLANVTRGKAAPLTTNKRKYAEIYKRDLGVIDVGLTLEKLNEDYSVHISAEMNDPVLFTLFLSLNELGGCDDVAHMAAVMQAYNLRAEAVREVQKTWRTPELPRKLHAVPVPCYQTAKDNAKGEYVTYAPWYAA